MFPLDPADEGGSALAAVDVALDALMGLELDRYSDDFLLELLQGLEARVRRLAAVDHALVAQLERRGVARERGMSSTTGLLMRLLRISAGEARARVRAAGQLAPRQVAGQVLEPEFPATAAAFAAGEISSAHARVVTQTLNSLPALVRDELFDTLEGELVGWAREFGPDQLGQLGRHLRDVLDPDGTLRDARHRERTRDLTIRQRPDGSVTGTFEGTAQFGEALLTLLDHTAAPQPADDGQPDPRTPGQRRHDGLLDAMLAALRAGTLGTTSGVSTTIVITLTGEQLETGRGLARTGHGATIPVSEAIKHLGDSRILPVSLGPPDTSENGPPLLQTRPITGYGTSHRIFTETQRLAMAARDGGCAFPGCTVGAAWTQAHHVTEWQRSKRTSVDDGCLLCGWHHREFERLGWAGNMIDGIPHFQAPVWLDPTRTWQRNTAHSTTALLV